MTLAQQIDPAGLARMVRQACNSAALTLDRWQVTPIAYANVSSDSRGLYRVVGTAHGLEWSLVLKVLHAPQVPAADDLAQPFYWRREALAYQSALLPDAALDFAAPRCFDVDQRSERQVWLWLEDVAASDDQLWSIERFGLAARHLGQMQGRFLAGHPLPTQPWLSRGLMRGWVAASAPLIDQMAQPDVWQHPLLCRAFDAPVAQAVLELWAERERFFGTLDRLPQTLCHHDLWRKNLFARRTPDGREQTVAIDWELVGLGAAGEDLGNLLGVSLLNFDVPAVDAPRLADHLWQQYLAGLHAAGWRGDPQPIRLAYSAAAALRCVFSTAGWPVAIVRDEQRYVAETEQRWQRPITQVFAEWAAVTTFLLDQARHARDLLAF